MIYHRRQFGFKLLAAAAALAIGAFLLSGCGFGATVGVVDMAKVMSESPKVKGLQDQLNAKGKEITEKLEKEKPTISKEEYEKRQDAAYGEFMKMKQDFENQIDASLKQALDQIAKEKKLGVILYKNGVAHGGVDVTDEVIKRMQ